jgi:hypothetical protein
MCTVTGILPGACDARDISCVLTRVKIKQRCSLNNQLVVAVAVTVPAVVLILPVLPVVAVRVVPAVVVQYRSSTSTSTALLNCFGSTFSLFGVHKQVVAKGFQRTGLRDYRQ